MKRVAFLISCLLCTFILTLANAHIPDPKNSSDAAKLCAELLAIGPAKVTQPQQHQLLEAMHSRLLALEAEPIPTQLPTKTTIEFNLVGEDDVTPVSIDAERPLAYLFEEISSNDPTLWNVITNTSLDTLAHRAEWVMYSRTLGQLKKAGFGTLGGFTSESIDDIVNLAKLGPSGSEGLRHSLAAYRNYLLVIARGPSDEYLNYIEGKPNELGGLMTMSDIDLARLEKGRQFAPGEVAFRLFGFLDPEQYRSLLNTPHTQLHPFPVPQTHASRLERVFKPEGQQQTSLGVLLQHNWLYERNFGPKRAWDVSGAILHYSNRLYLHHHGWNGKRKDKE